MIETYLYDTMTRAKHKLEPTGAIKFYSCGPTVYSTAQIGNLIAYIRWDLLSRILRANNYEVVHVMNITDVGHLVSDADDGEDKMEKGARRDGITAWDVAKNYTEEFFRDSAKLNIIRPNVVANATDHIDEQIDMIRRLDAAGHTYRIDDGIYFDVTTINDYGKLTGHVIDVDADVQSRIGDNQQKRHAQDFALWKFTPDGTNRDMEWDSPWGKGFPGWHIECSAMALRYLGETIDIHAGGIDHIAVHHTNEIAQTESVTGKPMSRFWVHSNFLKIDGQKLSKSLGNSYFQSDIISRGFDPLDFRMFALQGHYRSEMNFSWDNLAAARSRRLSWRNGFALRHQLEVDPLWIVDLKELVSPVYDDINTPQLLSKIDDVLSSIKDKLRLPGNIEQLMDTVDSILGLSLAETTADIDQDKKDLIKQRDSMRLQKDWSGSDRVRQELAAVGVIVRDTSAGGLWEYAG